MSAYVVSDKHINTLVTFGKLHRCRVYFGNPTKSLDFFDSADQIASILYKANVDSVNYRYNDSESADGFKYRTEGVYATPVQIIKACDCFDYQSCEVPDYENTTAAKLIDSIRRSAIRALPGYDSASWGIQ
jgi:hypothetical protein